MEKIKKWTHKKAERAVKIDFVRFFLVGIGGFSVTMLSLSVLHGVFGLHITPATFISSEMGLLLNFFFHLNWTYNKVDHSHKSTLKKAIHFHMSSWSGVVIITLLTSVGVSLLNLNYLISLMGAAAITMFWNFFWTKYYIFKGHTPQILMKPEDLAD